MKNLSTFIFLVAAMLIVSTALSAQSAYSLVKAKIENLISSDSHSWKVSKYMGGLTLNDVTEKNGILEAKGTFKYKVAGVGTINYTAELKMVLDELIVKQIYWTQPYSGIHYVIKG